MTIRFAWVTDVPSPYRNHLHERMTEIFPRHGIELMVHFMAWTEHRRPWRFAPEELHYPWVLHRNPVAAWERRAFHVNPGLVTSLRRDAVDAVMVGGWGTPSHLLTPLLLPSRVVKILGCESHLGSVRRQTGIVHAIKRAVVRRYDAFLVPGVASRELLQSLDPGVAHKPWVWLPNVIDARQFRDGVAARRPERVRIRSALGVAATDQLWFCPARLSPEKGLAELLPLLAGVRGLQLLIAGEGPLRVELESLIERERLPVRLLGQRTESQVVELYAAADVFVLPSLADASPLTAVEAAAAHLPLLLSTHAGNCGDLVEDGVNGWRFDVEASPETRRELLQRVAATPRPALATMGQRSGEIYQERFDSDTCVTRLAEFIVEQVKRHRSR